MAPGADHKTANSNAVYRCAFFILFSSIAAFQLREWQRFHPICRKRILGTSQERTKSSSQSEAVRHESISSRQLHPPRLRYQPKGIYIPVGASLCRLSFIGKENA